VTKKCIIVACAIIGGFMLPINKTISMIERYNLSFRDHQFAKFKLKGYQASFLIEISKQSEYPMEALIETMHVDKSTITRGIQACVDLGYVVVSLSETDRRYKRLTLTPLGLEVKNQCVAILKKQRLYLMQDFDEESETQFLSFLNRLYTRAKELSSHEENL
jgi:DNA-binding MarR family transcriptional regulator